MRGCWTMFWIYTTLFHVPLTNINRRTRCVTYGTQFHNDGLVYRTQLHSTECRPLCLQHKRRSFVWRQNLHTPLNIKNHSVTQVTLSKDMHDAVLLEVVAGLDVLKTVILLQIKDSDHFLFLSLNCSDLWFQRRVVCNDCFYNELILTRVCSTCPSRSRSIGVPPMRHVQHAHLWTVYLNFRC